MMTNNWTYSPLADDLKSDLPGYDPLIERLLLSRGITNRVAAEKFLKPDYVRDLYDPFLLKGMSVAVPRILRAIRKDQKVVIFGDYDADGVPASAVIAEFFKAVGFDNFSVYIPHRHKESYGLSLPPIKNFIKDGVELVITVDCGITAVTEVAYANKHGLEIIITDHHLAPAELPQALAIINPKQPDCLYPDKMLAGAGVAFKLVTALAKQPDLEFPAGQEKWLLDLVAIATVSDMVPLVDENRALVYFGLKVLQKTRRLGLLRLFNQLRLRAEYLSEDDIGFMIGPRINSAGRMSHASEAYFLLTTTSETEADTLATKLEKQNKTRRKFVEEILLSVSADLEGKDLPSVVVCGNDDWSIGVLGLAAGRLSEKFGKTFFVWSKNGHGELKGSCRSDGSINVVDLMKAASGETGLFLDFGGHAAAGGFSLLSEKLPEMTSALNEAYDNLDKIEATNTFLVDGELSLTELTPEFYRQVFRLAPFGIGNPKPVFMFRNVEIKMVKSFGSGGVHLELIFENPTGQPVKAIAFFACQGESGPSEISEHSFGSLILKPKLKVNLLAQLEISYFGFKKELRLRIVDLERGS